MYALYTQLNDYDQPEMVCAVFSNKPTDEQIYTLLFDEQFEYISKNKIEKLLAGKHIFSTESGKREPWGYNEFWLKKIKEGTWL